MSAPRTKRQFAGAASDPAQRQITSFFANNNNGISSSSSLSPNSSARAPPPNLLNGPALPATVQTNLLSVGMRVRKSVPEGYKTGSTYSAFALWDESGCDGLPPSSPSSAAVAEGRSRANAFSSPRELLPFCGIHKVGGLATPAEDGGAPASAVAAVPCQPSSLAAAIEDDDAVPGLLASSQDSIVSTGSSVLSTTAAASNTRKRIFAEDDEEAPEMPDRLHAWRGEQYDGQISPRSLAPVGWGNGRVMAVPRKGKLRNKMGSAPAPREALPVDGSAAAVAHAHAHHAGLVKKDLGQENVMVVDDDFEEAEFLDGPQSWEVEMDDI